jgi:hypothetical protein
MNGTSGDQEVLRDLGMMKLTRHLELHFALQHGYQFIRRVPEVLPFLPRRIGPKIAAKSTRRPFSGDFLAIEVSRRGSSEINGHYGRHKAAVQRTNRACPEGPGALSEILMVGRKPVE